MFVHINMFEHIIKEFALGSTVFEPIVFSDMFGATEMRAVFSHEALTCRELISLQRRPCANTRLRCLTA